MRSPVKVERWSNVFLAQSNLILSYLGEKWRLLRGIVEVVHDEGRSRRHGQNSQRTILHHCQESDDFLSNRKKVCCSALAWHARAMQRVAERNCVGMYRIGLRASLGLIKNIFEERLELKSRFSRWNKVCSEECAINLAPDRTVRRWWSSMDGVSRMSTMSLGLGPYFLNKATPR